MSQNQHVNSLELFSTLKLQDASVVADLFTAAQQANLNCPLRQGVTVHLPATGNLLMTGDLHDHIRNFMCIVHLAELDASPDNHLVLHEMIHGEHKIDGRDMSIRILAKVAALKVAYPTQVHLMLGNHELAQLAGEGIIKNSTSVVDVFNEGIEFLYADNAQKVCDAMNGFIRSMLLAVRCPNSIICSHSLPSPQRLGDFDPSVIDRDLTDQDLAYRGSAYDMAWGRNHTQLLADDLADDWNVRLFIMGHQPADMGYEIQGDSMLILASNHSHGMALPIDLAGDYHTIDDLISQIIPLASVVI